MNDLEHPPSKIRKNVRLKINTSSFRNFSNFFSNFSSISDSVITTTSVNYIIFILVFSSVIFTVASVQHIRKYTEIFILILITASLTFLIFLLIDIYVSKRSSKLVNDNNFETYTYVNNSHSDIFYLKIGAIVFLLGTLIHSSMTIIFEVAFLRNRCQSYLSLVFEIAVPVYLTVVLLFVMKFSHVVINRNVILARFFIMHCIGTSIAIGLYKIISEGRESLVDSRYFRSYQLNCTNLESLEELYKKFSPHLYPFVIEFCILSGGIFTIIWFRIGQTSDNVSLKSGRLIHIDYSRSLPGFLYGFILIVATICFIILSYVLAAEQDYFRPGPTIDEIFELLVFAVIGVAVVIAFVQTSKLSISTEQDNIAKIDNVLLFIGVPGVLMQTVLCLIPAILTGSTIITCNSLIQIFQLFLQTSLIASRQHRYCDTVEQIREKPGRQYIAFLAIANISLWIYYAFSNYSLETHLCAMSLYGKTAWRILYYLTLPFVMFYRFHSSVCFAHIWKHSYMNTHH